jgi:hypothetical protein
MPIQTIKELRQDLRETQRINRRMSSLLTQTVRVLRGPPPSDTLWSWHDIPELTRKMMREKKDLEKRVARLTKRVK